MKFYFNDDSTGKEGIINAESKKEALMKLINIIDDEDFTNELIKDLLNYEIDFRDITSIKEYE